MKQKSTNQKIYKVTKPIENSKRKQWIPYVVVLVFAFILYGNTIRNHYSLDDTLVVYKNELVMKGVKAIPEILSSHYREDDRNEYGYRPIAQITFAIESQFFKQNPHVSHFINVLLYALLLMLLFAFLKKIFPEFPVAYRMIIVLLYAAHPIHTEAIASLKNREELLCFIFGAAAILFFISALNTEKYRIISVIAGCISIVFSVLSKQTGVIFCIIIPLVVLQFFMKPVQWKELLARKNKEVIKKIIYFSGASLILILIGLFTYRIPEIALPAEYKILNGYENPLFLDGSTYNRLCLGFMGLLYYLKLVFFPYPLCFYYGFDMIPLTGIGDLRVILSIIIHGAFLGFAIKYFYQNKMISFGILFYLIGIIMFANWYAAIPGIIGERLIFIASFGFCLALVGLFIILEKRLTEQRKKVSGQSSKLIYLLASIMLLFYSLLTIGRNNDWKNEITLYSADIVHLERSAKANSLYADAVMRLVYEKINKKKNPAKSEIELALKHYEKTIEIYPDYASVYNNIGTIYFMFYKDYTKALPYFIKASEVDSLSSETTYNLAYAYDLSGDTAKALFYYEKAVGMDTSNAELISRWANLVNTTGDLQKAIELNMRIVAINPLLDRPYINIGNYYGALRDTATAVSYWEKAIAVVPVNDKLNAFLAAYFKKKGDEEKYKFYSSKITQGAN